MKVLLIPSAILVPGNMRSKIGELPTALYPLNEVTMLEHIYRKYSEVVDKIIVVGYKKHMLLEDYIHWKKLPVEVVVADKLGDLGYTVYCGVKKIIADGDVEKLYINFADTLLGDEVASYPDNCAFFSEDNLNEEWTFFEENNGAIEDVIDKKAITAPTEESKKMFVGVFSINNVKEFNGYLTDALLSREYNIDSFYCALIKYSKKIAMNFTKTKQWFDVGHSENYYKAKTGVEARSFNSIEIDESRGILKKRSSEIEKFLGEINWYIKMPRKLQYLLPRVYDYSLDRDNPYIEMEYYGYHTLHELLMFSDMPLVKWQDILRKLLFIVEDMGRYTVNGDEADTKAALKDIYIDKTILRLNKLRDNDKFKDLFDNNIIINGVEHKSLNEYIDIFVDLANKMLIENYTDAFTVIHGDLCFANILIEENHSFLRVIDPRGKFGGYDIYGDQRYELAKIMHTLEGHYDYIIEDMFTVEKNGCSINFNVPGKSDDILSVFLDVFKNKLNKIDEVRLIEASLFLSMVPLHSDHLERQYAMLVTGIQLLEKVMERVGK